MASNPPAGKGATKAKIMGFIEQHPIIIAGIVAGIGLAVFMIIRGKSAVSNSPTNTVTGVPTDAAGNPITGGFDVSPQLSNSDLQAQFTDLEQQILNWEQSFQPGNVGSNPAPTPNPTPNPPPGPVPPQPVPNPTPNPNPNPIPVGNGGSVNPPPHSHPRMPPIPVPQQLWATVQRWLNPNTPDSSLWAIFRDPRYNPQHLSWSAWEANVLRLNPSIHNPNVLHPGQRVRIR